MKLIFKWSLIAVVAICMIVFISMTDMSEVLKQLNALGWKVSYVFVVSLGAYLAGAMAWKYSFNNSDISLFRLFYTRTIGETIAIFNPGNILAGDAFKHYSLKSSIFNTYEIFDSIVLSRLLMIGTQLLLSLICVQHIFPEVNVILWASCVVLLLSFSTFYLVKRTNQFTPAFLKKISKWIKLKNRFKLFRELWPRLIMKIKNSPRRFFMALTWTVIHWLLGALEILVILFLLGVTPGFFNCLSIDMGVVIMKSLGGIIPGQFGVEELSNKLMLQFTGLHVAGLWLSVSVIRRAKQLVWIAVCATSYMIHTFIHTKKIKNGNTILDA